MQFWLGVVAGLSVGWLFDWLVGRRAIRAGQAPGDGAPELLDAPATPYLDEATVTTATNDANNDAIDSGETVDASG